MFRASPEALEWWRKLPRPDEAELPELDYAQWLDRKLSQHGSGKDYARSLVAQAQERQLCGAEWCFLQNYVESPQRGWKLPHGTKEGFDKEWRNASVRLDYRYLREVEKYPELKAWGKLATKYGVSEDTIKRVVNKRVIT